MSSFNTKQKVGASTNAPAVVRKISNATANTHNLAGGQAFRLTPHYRLAFSLFTTFLEPTYYKSPAAAVKEIQQSIKDVRDPKFVAKAALYARNEYGMRAASHLAAAEVAKNVKGEQWTKSFFDKVVHRVDDASEIMAAYIGLYGKPIPNSLKKGLAKAMTRFSPHQLAKYKGENKGIKLVDLFNLVHPKPGEQLAGTFSNLMGGNLASTGTWESALSAAGQNAENEEDKANLKAEAWKELISSGKIGYFALLRNLRNIAEQCDSMTVAAACELLTDEKRITGSLVLPFRFLTANRELKKINGANARTILEAINKATEISVRNVPVFNGNTLVALDVSGSMGHVSDPKSPASIGSLFAAVIARSNNADLMLFDTRSTFMNYRKGQSVIDITEAIHPLIRAGGTDFKCIFTGADKRYDRIIILSDMQAWVGYHTPVKEYGAYCAGHKVATKLYCFDLQGHGTSQFPQEHVYSLAGFSDKTLDLMKVLEEDPAALINKINAVEL